MGQITSFSGEYDFLSNFYLCEIKLSNLTFSSSEALFQAMKSPDPDSLKEFAPLSPSESKQLGHAIPLRKDWEIVKDIIMKSVVRMKFNQNPELKHRLLNTGDTELIDGNHWHDNYWGDCSCDKCKGTTGKNMLGKILMELRDEYRKDDLIG